jgi:Spy/CpxP family protein refolding chaperone
MKKTLLLLSLTGTMMFASTAAELTKTNCASCHMLTTPTPDMIPTMKAPAMDAVMFHINLVMQDKKEIKDFIVDYVQYPKASKSVCESNKVQHFGVMPSLIGKVSEQDLATIVEYVMANFPTPEFVAMIKEVQKNDKMNGLLNSPFLINQEALPHFTGMLERNWDKEKLSLTNEQKEKLLAVRNETRTGVKKLKMQIEELEAEVIDAMIDREAPGTVESKVDEIAKLKAEVTKIHLKCISNTTNILSDEQIASLLPFWE